MANSAFKALSSTDAVVLNAFRDIGADIGADESAKLIFQLSEGNSPAQTVRLVEAENSVALTEILPVNAAALRSLSLQIPIQSTTVTVTVNRPSSNDTPGFDSIHWSVPDQLGDKLVARVAAAVQRAFRAAALPSAPSRILGPELEEYYRRREESIRELDQLAIKLIEETAKAHSAIRAKAEEEREHLQQQVQERERQRDEKYAELLRQLDEQRDALAQRERELDDRSRTHARRQLRADLKSDLNKTSQSFALTADTGRKRLPIHIAFIVLLAGSAWWTRHALLNFDAMATSNQTPLVVAGYVRLILGALAFFGFVVYYIRWNDVWADRHAAEEFRLKRLGLDVDRASWVVETALEWRDEKGSEMPSEMLDRLTTELFSASPDGARRTRHPSEDLASRLLGASTSLKMQLPGIGEATIDRKGLRSLEGDLRGDSDRA